MSYINSAVALVFYSAIQDTYIIQWWGLCTFLFYILFWNNCSKRVFILWFENFLLQRYLNKTIFNQDLIYSFYVVLLIMFLFKSKAKTFDLMRTNYYFSLFPSEKNVYFSKTFSLWMSPESCCQWFGSPGCPKSSWNVAVMFFIVLNYNLGL